MDNAEVKVGRALRAVRRERASTQMIGTRSALRDVMIASIVNGHKLSIRLLVLFETLYMYSQWNAFAQLLCALRQGLQTARVVIDYDIMCMSNIVHQVRTRVYPFGGLCCVRVSRGPDGLFRPGVGGSAWSDVCVY
jgi:hypothetical protein